MTPEVSIIIPVFNAERYLRQCLESVKGQTLREIEVICVDDGSTDGSPEILDEYAARDGRFRIIHQPNAGQAFARNRGLERATGRYVAFLDSDDWLEAEHCEKICAAAESAGTDILFFFFYLDGFPVGRRIRFHRIGAGRYSGEAEKIRLVCRTWTVIWNMLYRREMLERGHVRFLEGMIYEDTHFVFKAALCAEAIQVLPEKLYHYRYGSGYSTAPEKRANLLKKVSMYPRMLDDLLPRITTTEAVTQLYGMKLTSLRRIRRRILRRLRPEYLRLVREAITQEDWKRIDDPDFPLKPAERSFYYWILKSRREGLRAYWRWTLHRLRRNFWTPTFM